MSSGTILQNTMNSSGPIVIASNTFNWSGGNINYTSGMSTGLSKITINSGAELKISYSGGGAQPEIGDSIVNNGTLTLANTGTVYLNNSPTITNNGTISIPVAGDGGKLNLTSGNNDVSIQNSGTIQEATGLSTGYTIQEPVNNNAAAAKIEVDSATLIFAGADPSSTYTVNQSAGTIAITHGATCTRLRVCMNLAA